jgi:general secretion pathway protein L
VFTEFFVWWRQHLLELLPESLRRGSGAEANALVVDATTPGLLKITRRRRGALTRVTQARLDEPGLVSVRAALNDRPNREAVLLRVPPATVLERPVTLPLAAERDIERVLTYEMERLTPFAADEVFWAHSVQARDRTHGRLQLVLTLVPRMAVQALLDTLATCAGRPSLIEAETSSGPRFIRLQHETGPGTIARLSPRTAALSLAALAALVVISPFLRQSLDLAEAQSQLDTLAPRIALVDNLRNRINGAGAGGDAVASETRRLGDMLQALAAITEILPDDSYLTEFAMRERKITLSGLSASAPRLIGALSADRRIRNPAFTAPVTKDNNQKDVFSIRADLAQTAGL